MEIKEITILDIIIAILASIPACVVFINTRIILTAPLKDMIIIFTVGLITALLSLTFIIRIIIYIIYYFRISGAKPINSKAIVTKSFLNTKMTIDELVEDNLDFNKNFDGFEIEQSRNLFEKILMETNREGATNDNHVEFIIFNKKFTIKTQMTDKELRENNIFRIGQEYRLYKYRNKYYLEKNRIIYVLRKGHLKESNYSNWIICKTV